MIGELPEKLLINKTEYEINTDFRIALIILQAANDAELNDYEKACVIINILFCDEVKPEDTEEALKEAAWFLDGGNNYDDSPQSSLPIVNWEQDEKYIFSAVNKVAGREIRSPEHLHWWTFLSFLAEIGEGMFSQIVNIRRKQNEGKTLDKTEQEFYKTHKNIIDIKRDTSKEYLNKIKEEKDRLNKLIGTVKK